MPAKVRLRGVQLAIEDALASVDATYDDLANAITDLESSDRKIQRRCGCAHGPGYEIYCSDDHRLDAKAETGVRINGKSVRITLQGSSFGEGTADRYVRGTWALLQRKMEQGSKDALASFIEALCRQEGYSFYRDLGYTVLDIGREQFARELSAKAVAAGFVRTTTRDSKRQERFAQFILDYIKERDWRMHELYEITAREMPAWNPSRAI